MPITLPRHVDCPWPEARDLAMKELEPVFLPVTPYVDDRGWSMMNLMTRVLCPEGQINFSMQNPGTIKAWHRHQHQMDVWMCVHGHLKAGIHRDEDNQSWAMTIGQMRPGALFIPPGLWHGAATIGADAAGLLYFVTQAFDPENPDEERRAFDSIQGFPWEVEHR